MSPLQVELHAKVVEALKGTPILSLQALDVLAALGLDNLPALAEQGASGLGGQWFCEHDGGLEPVERTEIAYAVLHAAFGGK